MKRILPLSLSATLNNPSLGLALLLLSSIPGVSVARAAAPRPLIASQTAAATRQDGASAAAAQSLAQIVAATINEQAKLVPSDGTAGDAFGSRVSLSGDRALIGASRDSDNGVNSGAAYIFLFDGSTWREEAKLKPSDGGEQDSFGFSVCLSGDRALIGADNDQNNGAAGGSAYVFAFDGTTWTQQAKLTPSDLRSAGFFGFSVSLSGDRALIGSTGANASKGAAYVFVFDSATWTQEAKLSAADGETFDGLGASVSLAGNRALVGSQQAHAAYVFLSDGTIWSQEAKLTVDELGLDFFGAPVSLSANRALIGASGDDEKGLDSGAAYIFAFDGTTWNQEAKLASDDEVAGDFFGSSVSLSGKRALVGATKNSSDGPSAAYLFFFDGAQWNQQRKLTPSDGPIGDFNSVSVSLSGKRVLVGTADSAGDGGAAYVFGRGSQRQ